MIRINLLGTPKPKKGKRPAAALGSVNGPEMGIALIVVVVLLIAAAANGVYYVKLTRDAARLQRDITTANAEYARLTQVKLRYQELEKQKNAYKQRVDVIDQLQSRQAGPVNLLTTIGNTVNHSDEVWLSQMTETPGSISLLGTALSVDAVAEFMHNLQNTGYFKAVEIKSSYQDEAVKDMQAFVFQLTCEKQTSTPAATQPPARNKS